MENHYYNTPSNTISYTVLTGIGAFGFLNLTFKYDLILILNTISVVYTVGIVKRNANIGLKIWFEITLPGT